MVDAGQGAHDRGPRLSALACLDNGDAPPLAALAFREQAFQDQPIDGGEPVEFFHAHAYALVDLIRDGLVRKVEIGSPDAWTPAEAEPHRVSVRGFPFAPRKQKIALWTHSLFLLPVSGLLAAANSVA